MYFSIWILTVNLIKTCELQLYNICVLFVLCIHERYAMDQRASYFPKGRFFIESLLCKMAITFSLLISDNDVCRSLVSSFLYISYLSPCPLENSSRLQKGP